MLYFHLVIPRVGNLNHVYHVFGYLRKHHNTELVFNPSDPMVDESAFERRDWASSEFGHLLEERKELPPIMPQPRGTRFIARAKIDDDHAAGAIDRRSITGSIVHSNYSPMFWHSKNHSNVESSSFGLELTAMKACCECLHGYRHRLQMMWMSCESPSRICGDN